MKTVLELNEIAKSKELAFETLSDQALWINGFRTAEKMKENMTTNAQRTYAWLESAGKVPNNPQHVSVQIGCHLEEMCEQVELVRVDQDGWAAVIERIATDLKSISDAIKSGKIIAHIPNHLRTEFLKELCDGKVTADGVAYQLGANIDEADKRVIDANWSKFDENGNAIFDEGGKIKKSELYKKADLKGLV